MGQEEIKCFVEMVNNDATLQEKIKGFTGIPEESIRKLSNLAKENGLEFSPSDWKLAPKCEEEGKSAHGFSAWSEEIILPWMK